MKTKKLNKHKNQIINELNKSINIFDDITGTKVLEILCRKYKSDKCNYSSKDIQNKVFEHGKRVNENAKIIVSFLETNNIRKFTKEEKEDIEFAALTHDVGKLYKEKHHNEFSKIIIEYIFSNNVSFNEKRKERILDMIGNHNKKDENREIISDLDMIIRDADLFDENCGKSLLLLATSYILNNNDMNNLKENLNHIKYIHSDYIINKKSSDNYMNEIKRLINMPCNIYLYEHLVNLAVKDYDKLTYNHRLGQYTIISETDERNIITFIDIK